MQVAVMYEELLRLTLSGINPPHHTVAFGFTKLVEWTPGEIVASLSVFPLQRLAAMLEAAYLQAARPPAYRQARLRSYFAPLHAAMPRTLDEVLCDDKTRCTYRALLARTVGQTTLHDYYTDPTNQQKAANVQRQLRVTLAEGQDRRQHQHHLGQRHRGGFFFHRKRMRATKKCARMTKVIC